MPEPAVTSQEREILQTAGQNGETQGVGRVKARAYLSVKKLPPGGECEIIVFVTIKQGWHINSHSVQKEWQIPTEVTLSSRLGTKLARVAYPKGRLARVPGSEEPALVYEREAAFRGVLTIPREAAGRNEEFRIQVRYQACDDRECEQPKTVKLVGKVPIAREGEAVEPDNSNLFPKSR
jgi:thiol:disulfide interchange protein DsbD